MFRKLMYGLAAIAVSVMFVACNKDIYDTYVSAVETSVVKNYEEAFITRFGQPAEDRDWGFSNTVAGTRATEAEWTEYAKSLNDYLNPTTGSDVYGNTWQLNTVQISLDEMRQYTLITEADITQTGTTLTNLYYYNLYDENGAYIMNTSSYPANGDGKHYRIASGTEITSKIEMNGEWGKVNDVVLFVEGTLHLNGNTLNGPTIVVDNGGELIIDGNTSMSNTGRIIVLAGGRITGGEGVSLTITNGAHCYNAGTISYVGELNVNGSNMYNNGTINVDVLRNTSGGSFTNFGQITARTNTQAGDTYNSIVVNGCYMHFTADAGIGTLTLLNNSRLDVDGRAQFAGTQTLYDLSMINCQDIQCQQASFNGPTSEDAFAVVKISRDVYVGYGGDITATGNVYFDWAKKDVGLYQNGEWSELDNEWSTYHGIKVNMSKFANETDATLYIPAGECTGAGYSNIGETGNTGETGETGNTEETGESGNTGDTTTPTINKGGNHQTSSVVSRSNAICRICVEDLSVSSNSDFDFNDVVYDICPNSDGQTTTLVIRAIGGELPLYIEDQEVHEAVFGATNNLMMNTGRDGAIDYSKECGTITINKYIASREEAGNISMYVKRSTGDFQLKAEKGEVPSKICVGTDYEWCSETIDIDRMYNVGGVKLFQQYVQGNYANDVWYRALYQSR